MSEVQSKKQRFRPVKVKITKCMYEELLRIEEPAGPAVCEILRQVAEGQEAKPESLSTGMQFRECLDLLQGLGVRDKVIIPEHGASGVSVGRFIKQLATLEVTAEDVEKLAEQMLRWKHAMALEKLTAILPSMITEARAKISGPPLSWKPPTWEVVDATEDSSNWGVIDATGAPDDF